MASITLDANEGLGYIKLRQGVVSRSLEVDERTIVDLDEFDVILGVELLQATEVISVDKIKEVAHLHAEDVEELTTLLNSLARMSFSSGSLTSQSKVKASAQNGHSLEAC